jgi:hypothetical protein
MPFRSPGQLGRDQPLTLGVTRVLDEVPPHLVPDQRLPGCVAEPLWLRGRVIGLLLCVGAPVGALHDIAKQGAAALELANDATVVVLAVA